MEGWILLRRVPTRPMFPGTRWVVIIIPQREDIGVRSSRDLALPNLLPPPPHPLKLRTHPSLSHPRRVGVCLALSRLSLVLLVVAQRKMASFSRVSKAAGDYFHPMRRADLPAPAPWVHPGNGRRHHAVRHESAPVGGRRSAIAGWHGPMWENAIG